MRTYWLGLCVVGIAGLSGCKPPAQATPPPADAPPEIVALSGASVLLATGDIASCTSDGDEATARLVDSLLTADSAANVEGVVAALGDNVYTSGSAREYAACFTPSWGDSTKAIMKRIRPTPGNHEHLSSMAAPYYEYFGDRAGSSKKGYYSYDLGEWHIVVLNSEIVVNSQFTQEERQAQLDWLKQDLDGSTKACTLAYWHHPRFSSGWHGSELRVEPFWQLLHDTGADIVLSGHDHEYERFDPQTPAGVVDTARGLVQFVVGTGGGELRGFRGKPAPNSSARVEGHFGILKMTLGALEYQYAFIDVNGRLWDLGSGKCHR